MKLAKIIKISATLNCLTGLHIGGGDTEIHIGGIDNQVVKHPITDQPYIPGSSLKGKMRSMLEWCSGAVKEKPLSFCDYKAAGKDPKVLTIIQLFGMGQSEDLSPKDAEIVGATRLSFWDCNLSEAWLKEVDETHALKVEAKSENIINRIKGTAEHPRQTERVPAGATFDFNLTLKVYDTDDEKQLLETALRGMKLLELDSLGGSGSRGYGKVRFENVTIQGAAPGAADYSKIEAFA
ncbi:MAG TPA: type III-A CRISPR-associated RAMP protein Csm3 [Sutterella sp.]|nr:type III-A CRISPR-associated RAMP protein Csm3 [Sutterella sp.]